MSDSEEEISQQGWSSRQNNNGVPQRPGSNHPPTARGQQAQQNPLRFRIANVPFPEHRKLLSELQLNQEYHRLTSFAQGRWVSSNVSPIALARCGLFYLGDLDRTQCFSCGGILRNWNEGDDVEQKHRSQYPGCAMARGREKMNVAVADLPESSQELETKYPCDFPTTPRMACQAERFETFNATWHPEYTSVTPEALAQAGFFFKGSKEDPDLVKCWYCNGGLREWQPGDDPWVEHAKWYPTCQFLLRNKGQQFAHRALASKLHPNRPALLAPPQSTEQAPVFSTDQQTKMRRRDNKAEVFMSFSIACKSLIEMGYPSDVIKLVVQERMSAGSGANLRALCRDQSALLDAVEAKIETIQRRQDPQESSTSSSYASAGHILGEPHRREGNAPSLQDDDQRHDERRDPEDIGVSGNIHTFIGHADHAEIQSRHLELHAGTCHVTHYTQPSRTVEGRLEMLEAIVKKIVTTQCRVCSRRPADVLLLPCNHFCCCTHCKMNLQVCPVCQRAIENHIKARLD